MMMTPSQQQQNNNSQQHVSAGDASLSISWHDSAWIPILNPTNVLDYFCQRTNPFYDRTCNNEVVRMQGLDRSHVTSMRGLEYVLIHAQAPVLYVIRKQHRSHVTGSGGGHVTTPLADYYVVAGVVYRSPDLSSVLNSRVFAALYACQSAFGHALARVRFEPVSAGLDSSGGDGASYGWSSEETPKASAINSVHVIEDDDEEASPAERCDPCIPTFLVDKDEAEAATAHLRRVDVIIDRLLRTFPVTRGDLFEEQSVKSETSSSIPQTTPLSRDLPDLNSQVSTLSGPSSGVVASVITVGTKRHNKHSTELSGTTNTIGGNSSTAGGSSSYKRISLVGGPQQNVRMREDSSTTNTNSLTSSSSKPFPLLPQSQSSNHALYKKTKHTQ